MICHDLPGERWRPIAGYEDMYEVSDLGRVKSLAREAEVLRPGYPPFTRPVHERILRPSFSTGSLKVSLNRDKIGVKRNVSTLVAEAFLPERDEGQLLTFRDGDPRNVVLGNLIYATRKEVRAAENARGTLPKGERHRSAKLTPDDIRAIRDADKDVSNAALADRFGVHSTHISDIRLGKQWRHVE